MIRLVEVGPRDGLQNIQKTIPTEVKVAFIDALSQSGLPEIEVSAFVSPKWIPQLADASEVFKNIHRVKGVTYSALVPNEQGMERALAASVQKIAVFTAASETFNQKNIHATIAESIQRFEPVMRQAQALGIKIRGYLSTAFHCPYEGKIQPRKVQPVVQALLDAGADEISIGDTIGKATPSEVKALLELLLYVVPKEQIALHFHDTFGAAKANVLAAYEMGIRIFDGSASGLGGCPYAPGAKGNIATEDLIDTLAALSEPFNISRPCLDKAHDIISPYV